MKGWAQLNQKTRSGPVPTPMCRITVNVVAKMPTDTGVFLATHVPDGAAISDLMLQNNEQVHGKELNKAK